MNPNDPARYVARTTSDLVTSRQIVRLVNAARRIGTTAERASLERCGCRETELNQAAAEMLIASLAADVEKETIR